MTDKLISINLFTKSVHTHTRIYTYVHMCVFVYIYNVCINIFPVFLGGIFGIFSGALKF
jgi:hypothetical protein